MPSGWQVDEGTLVDMVRLQRLEDLAAQVNEPSPHLACEPQAGLIVVADQKRIDAVRFGAIAPMINRR
jgi:hypothetical protein